MNTKHRPFFYSLFLSRLADQILLFLVPLVIYQTTGSIALSGAAFFLETLPRFLSFPICGILCDRFSLFKLLHLSQLYRAIVCVGGMVGFALFGGIGWLIFISAVVGILTTQGLMAREVMLSQIFGGQRFEKIASYTQIADQLGMVLGPLVAAGLLKFWPWEYVVAATAGLFLMADGFIMVWRKLARPVLVAPEPAPSSWLLPLATAFRHLVKLPGLLDVVLLAAAVNLIIGVTLATSAAMVIGAYHQDSTYYALLQVAGAIATVVILFTIAHTSMSLKTLGITAYTTILVGGFMTGLSTHPNIYAIGFLLIVGFDKMFNVFIRSLRQKIIPRRDLGKTTGLVVMLNNLSQPLAGLAITAFSGIYGANMVIVVLSICMAMTGLIVGAVWQRRSPTQSVID